MTMFKAAAAGQTGAYHLLTKTPCQDSIAVSASEDGITAVLCDGAGSAERAEVISHAVARRLCGAVSECFEQWYESDDESIGKLLISLAARAVKERDPSLQADCTLILFAAEEDHSLLIHIGDGIAADTEKVISAAENGETDIQTYFLSGEHALQHIRIQRDPEWTDMLLLTSDGLSSVLYDRIAERPAPAVGIMAEWMRSDPSAAEEKLKQTMQDMFMDYTGDDMSIILICR